MVTYSRVRGSAATLVSGANWTMRFYYVLAMTYIYGAAPSIPERPVHDARHQYHDRLYTNFEPDSETKPALHLL